MCIIDRNSGADVSDFSTGFYYEGSDSSGGSANTYVNNAYYDSGSQNLRIEFGGDPLNQYVGGSYDIYNRFEIYDN